MQGLKYWMAGGEKCLHSQVYKTIQLSSVPWDSVPSLPFFLHPRPWTKKHDGWHLCHLACQNIKCGLTLNDEPHDQVRWFVYFVAVCVCKCTHLSNVLVLSRLPCETVKLCVPEHVDQGRVLLDRKVKLKKWSSVVSFRKLSVDCFKGSCISSSPLPSGSWVVSSRAKSGRLNSAPRRRSSPTFTSRTLGMKWMMCNWRSFLTNTVKGHWIV